MQTDFDLESYNYKLPESLIAQKPAAARDRSRLLVVDVGTGGLDDRNFADVTDYLLPGDLLVVNDTKVFPARLEGKKTTGGKVELFLLNYPLIATSDGNIHQAAVTGLCKSSKGVRPGTELLFGNMLHGVVENVLDGGKVSVRLFFHGDIAGLLADYGKVPLPPYIHRPDTPDAVDSERYQTVYARHAGAVAAPTAGLHFTPELLEVLKSRGVNVCELTLHVGYGTFAPLREPDIRDHVIHSECMQLSAASAELVNATKAAGNSVWAVGTTSVRALEFAADKAGRVQPFAGQCDLYIYPGYVFRVVDNIITNFHLPKSSLLLLVSAFAGRDQIFTAYEHAVNGSYRFYSYGDAMALIGRNNG